MAQQMNEQIMRKYIASFERGGSPKSEERLRWMFFDNPLKDSLVVFEEIENSEHYACVNAGFPLSFKSGDERISGLYLVDALTAHEHRGKGLFGKLSIQLNNHAAQNGYKYIYGIPNAQSSPVFFGKTNWHYYSTTPHKVKLINLCFPINRVLKTKLFISFPWKRLDANITRIKTFGQDHETFLQEIGKQYQFGLVRDAEFLNWRIARHPNKDYTIYQLTRNGKIAGIAIITIKYNRYNANIGYIVDLLYRTGDNASGKVLLEHCMYAFKKGKADIVFAWNKSSDFNGPAFKKLGFRLLPDKLRKIKLAWGIGVLDPKLSPPKREDFYMSYIDSDTV